ncbi:hypothetical protein BH09PSE6_BH09PSE6_07300 [soil metagenome]
MEDLPDQMDALLTENQELLAQQERLRAALDRALQMLAGEVHVQVEAALRGEWFGDQQKRP